MKPFTTLLFLVATATYFSEVAALSCYHCIHLEAGGGGGGTSNTTSNSTTPPPSPPQNDSAAASGGRKEAVVEEQDKYGIPLSSSCKNNPEESFLISCDTLNYQYVDMPPSMPGLDYSEIDHILRNPNVTSAPVGSDNSTNTTAGVVATKQTLKFTCAHFLFEDEVAAGRAFTLRTCVPTTRAAGFNESCKEGKLQELQGQGDQAPEIADFLKMFNDNWFAGDTRALVSTCNGDGCNGPSAVYNQCNDPPQNNSTVVDSANNSTTQSPSPSSMVGGSGQNNPLPPMVALVALLIIPSCTSLLM